MANSPSRPGGRAHFALPFTVLEAKVLFRKTPRLASVGLVPNPHSANALIEKAQS